MKADHFSCGFKKVFYSVSCTLLIASDSAFGIAMGCEGQTPSMPTQPTANSVSAPVPLIPVPAAVVSPSSSPDTTTKNVADVVGKAHQKNAITASHGHNGVNNIITPVPTSSNAQNVGDSSIHNQGLGCMVASGNQHSNTLEVHSHEVKLSTGTTSTVDMHGDNLIHVQTDGSHGVPIQGSNSCNGDHEHVTMTSDHMHQTLNNLVNTGDTTQAHGVTTHDNGDVTLHTSDNSQNNQGNQNGQDQEHKNDKGQGPKNVSDNSSDSGHSSDSSSNISISPAINNDANTNNAGTVNTTTIQNTSDVTFEPETPIVSTSTAVTNSDIPASTTNSSTIISTPTVVIPTTVESTPSISNGDAGDVNTNNTPVINNSNDTPLTTMTPTGSTINVNPIVDLNTDNVSTNFTSSLRETHTEAANGVKNTSSPNENQNSLIVIGQVIKLIGSVAEVDSNGQQHQLAVGDNVHMGSKYIATDPQHAVAQVKYFDGQIENVLG